MDDPWYPDNYPFPPQPNGPKIPYEGYVQITPYVTQEDEILKALCWKDDERAAYLWAFGEGGCVELGKFVVQEMYKVGLTYTILRFVGESEFWQVEKGKRPVRCEPKTWYDPGVPLEPPADYLANARSS